MKKNSKMNQDPLGKWINELGGESPSPKLYKLIITKLETRQLKQEYQPVIPALTMRLLICASAALFVLGIIYLPQEGNPGIWLELSEIKFSQIQIPAPQIPKLNIETNIILSSSILIFSIMAFIAIIVNSRKINY